MKKSQIVRLIVFLLVLSAAVGMVQGVFGLKDSRAYEHYQSYLDEEPGSLDGVYLGGSDVHAFWIPAVGWAEQGIAIWNYSIDSISADAILYLMKEARKTQPDALYIVSINTFKKENTELQYGDIHRVVDYMPFSLNKVRLILDLTKHLEGGILERLEYFLPVIRFHTRWDSLDSWSYGNFVSMAKTSMRADVFRNTVFDISEYFQTSEVRCEVPEDVRQAFLDLLDYCDRNQVKVLFVTVPQACSEQEIGQINTLNDLAAERGYPCLDALSACDEYGLVPETDFYNERHTNVHGALKYCNYLESYLLEHYSFTDKRGTKGWESWDRAAEVFNQFLVPFTLPFERSHAERDFSLDAPVLTGLSVQQQTVRLDWSPVAGADAYEVYRKTGTGAWGLIGETDSLTLSFTDSELEPETTYTYTVVPCRDSGGVRQYGSFVINGTAATTEALK